ncbi:unnamed protein product [Urochloa humidicola]
MSFGEEGYLELRPWSVHLLADNAEDINNDFEFRGTNHNLG